MKKTILRLFLAVMAVTAPLAARADLIYYEGFNYPNGNITNVSNNIWLNFSGNGVHDLLVNNGHLEVSTTGNTVTGANRADDDCRFLSQTNNSVYTNTVQLIYASFTVICTNLPNGAGSYFASFYRNGSPGGYVGRILAFTNGTVLPNTWRLAVAGNTASTAPVNGGYPVDLALNTAYQVVVELDPVNLDAATIWINPLDVNQTGSAPTETHYTSSDGFGFATTASVNAFAFRQASSFGNGFWIVTNLALATTFAEAATNVWATNALAPVLLSQPSSVHNFPGSSFNLSVLANGQGLGSLTYQWLMNSNYFVNPNGNSSTLPFTSMPANSGTNYYNVIVTTAFGLSVTSAVAAVAIDTTPQPPIITSQPASEGLYAGQNAVLTASVASPGNVSFTWYSNNIVVSSGVTSSGYSSSLEMDNITAGYNNTTYKVAITNDVFASGVVSSNAVLTVKVPASVSIGYLHTLVNPTTWQATNVPPSIAYQATGIVTTYTNLTTGDTSSYYLQDGTGGINIFVTGGSTANFRPQQGDVYTFVGVLSSYTSGLELYADVTAGTVYPYTSYTFLSNNIAGFPTPRAINYNFNTNVAYANTNLGGSLVKIEDVYFGTNSGTTASITANTTATVTNSAGQVFRLFLPYLDLDIAGQTLPAYAYTVSGVLYSSGGVVTNTIVVTRFADINTNSAVADLSMVQTGPTNVLAGGTLIYTNTVSNIGPTPATNTVVTDTLPTGTTFVSATGGGLYSGGVVTWSLGTLAVNSSSKFTITVTVPASGTLTNAATASSSTPEFNPADNTSANVVTVISPAADLSVTETGPAYVFAGSNLSYTISVGNNGPSAASSVVVTDSLPATVSFVSATGGGVNNGGVVNWAMGSLANAGTSNVTVTVKAPLSGFITNSTKVASATQDPSLANNTSSQVITAVAPLPVAGPIRISGGNAAISWNAVAGPTYSVLWSTSVGGPYSSIASGLTSSPYTDTTHTNQVTGFYKIVSP